MRWSSYAALSHYYMWRTTAHGGTRPCDAVMDLLPSLSAKELHEVSAAAAAAASKVESRPIGRAGNATVADEAVSLARTAELSQSAAVEVDAEDAREPIKFCARRPFHPARLAAALRRVQASLKLSPSPGAIESASEVDEAMGEERVADDVSLHGIAWLATQPGLQAVVSVGEDGKVLVDPGDAWWACIPRSKWPEGLDEDIEQLWQEPHGDRGTELFLPPLVDARDDAPLQQLVADLEDALVDDAEWEGESEELDDPYADAWLKVLKSTESAERGARIADEVKRAFVAIVTSNRPAVSMSARVCAPCGGVGIGNKV